MFDVSEKLALEGGPKGKRTPFPVRKRHGDLEKRYLTEVIDSDMLFYYFGTKVFEFQRRFAQMYGRRYCVAVCSGSAAVHTALAVFEIPPGHEVITSPITDMGTLTGILYQGLVPVFADVDPGTLNMDPEAARRVITDRTRAIVVVHHAGLAADMEGFLRIGKETGIPIIEDCAQAYLCDYKGRLAGSLTPISAFSLNHFKHINCGSGGMVLTDDDRLRYYATLFMDKCFQRDEGIRNPFFLGPNYQMTELQGAVALAQLERLPFVVEQRSRLGVKLSSMIQSVPGISPQPVPEGCRHTHFMYLFKVDLEKLGCTSMQFAKALTTEGVPAAAHQVTGGRPVYLYDVLQKRSAFPGTTWPFTSADGKVDRVYKKGDCPVAEAAFDRWISIDVQEHYRDIDIEEIAFAIGKVAYHFSAATQAKVAGAA